MMQIDDNLGADADSLYALLMKTHEGLSDAESHALNARLVLLLMNALGDAGELRKLLAEARRLSGVS